MNCIVTLMFNGTIPKNLVAFSLKTSGACTDMLSYENDAIQFSKTAKTQTALASRTP